ncbi:hypothetical protein XELAEV_18029290mg [Xenopus laevis]|uniref:GIY-YIG domain-containing protein n=1 Tax=Xenopus laevis TaxID=8355 RepID=A0A974HHM0_XENLA|nr:hypothetical protein XELAEV_18029290mg [Xenopus laevis]
MGSSVAPSYANLFMANYENQYIYKSEFWRFILCYYHYIDDLFFFLQGTETNLIAFVNYLNTVPSSIRITAAWSKSSVAFLDVLVQCEAGTFKTSIYRKPTDRNTILHAASFHPTSLIKALPYSQMTRVKRITSEPLVLENSLESMADRFHDRGYGEEILTQAITKSERKVFVTKYTTASHFVAHTVKKHWHHLQTDAIIGARCQEAPMLAYKRGRNLKDMLVKGNNKAHYSIPHFLQNPKPGNYKCFNCSICNSMIQTTSFSHPRTSQRFQIKQRITCQSTYVVYALVCPCGLYYIGKTIQKLKDRFIKHKSVIKIGQATTPLVQHCIEYRHNVSSLRFMGIDQITGSSGGLDKNTLLLRKEAEWIFRLNTVTPMGLNDSLNLSCFLQSR